MLMDNLVSGMKALDLPDLYDTIERNQELDEKFFKKLLLLKTTPEYKNRPGNFFKHEFKDKLIMIDKIDKHMCKPFSLNNFKTSTNKSQ